jgi:hypothetical protein
MPAAIEYKTVAMPIEYAFEGRVALVTGGASGIGAAVAQRLEEGGAEVHVFDLVNGDDVTDSAQIGAAIEKLPRLDVLVCAAGVGGDSLHTEDVTDEEWRRVHSVNLDGVFFANRAAIPKMRAGGYGRIVNIASIAGKEGNPMAGAYSSSKAAGGRDRHDEGDREGRRRHRYPRERDRAGSNQDADAGPDVRGAHRLHDLADPARPDGGAVRGCGARLLARERGDDVLDRSVLRHLGRPGDLLIAG